MAQGKNTHRILLEVPTEWLPELAAAAEEEQRSRHKVMLRFVRQGLDLRSAAKEAAATVRNDSPVRVRSTGVLRSDVTPRFKKGGR